MTKTKWKHNKEQKFNKANKNLDKELRALPGDLLTEEIEDKTKVHEFDSPHEREQLVDDYFDQEKVDPEAEEKAILERFKESLGDPHDFKLTQAKIDVIRFRVIKSLVSTIDSMMESGKYTEAKKEIEKKQYLWFPKNNTEIYELREGNPPGDAGRIAKGCKHLKGFKLHIDVLDWPKRIVDLLVSLPSFKKVALDNFSGLRSENADGLIIPAGTFNVR